MKRCPKCGHQKFIVAVELIQLWEVDEEGEFAGVVSDCEQVLRYPKDDAIWECKKCHYEAEGSEFNVEE